MTIIFHFEEKIHYKNLTMVEAIPLLFSWLLSQVLEHLGFPDEPYLESRRVCEAISRVKKLQFVSGAPPLPLRDLAEMSEKNEKMTPTSEVLEYIIQLNNEMKGTFVKKKK